MLPSGLRKLRRRRSPELTDPESLRERVVECFLPVQQAWANRDGEALAGYVSEALRATMEQEFDDLEGRYAVNRLDDLELHEARVPSPPAPGDHAFTAEVSFSAREWTEDLRTGRPADGDDAGKAMRFDQRWRFVWSDDGAWVIDDVATTGARAA